MENVVGVIGIIFAVLTGSFFTYVMIMDNSTVTIEKSYYDQYKECKSKLVSPECKCDCGNGWMIPFTMLIFGGVGYAIAQLNRGGDNGSRRSTSNIAVKSRKKV
jgi:hypothetical protein